ncbi:uncharacterized protein SCODWIG_02642 [Saccharomycodes ludwigii]|uniref:Bud site selection protein 5 n=1 Tax=Saccharomycodes ludwigii TaxID=36035 RepID=A0A376B8E2_9ASCO|nr:hypothetical protein SCDLUD_004040 [Saccharomycodes ludwigii]KAH3899753.1 hypothetical protein SCDLUD_004040 [Saccharomycodes ludwigii]SSD60881.1 uncharacterized protein SCODWIG_02642 [Saccharomycodes ludwigii]
MSSQFDHTIYSSSSTSSDISFQTARSTYFSIEKEENENENQNPLQKNQSSFLFNTVLEGRQKSDLTSFSKDTTTPTSTATSPNIPTSKDIMTPILNQSNQFTVDENGNQFFDEDKTPLVNQYISSSISPADVTSEDYTVNQSKNYTENENYRSSPVSTNPTNHLNNTHDVNSNQNSDLNNGHKDALDYEKAPKTFMINENPKTASMYPFIDEEKDLLFKENSTKTTNEGVDSHNGTFLVSKNKISKNNAHDNNSNEWSPPLATENTSKGDTIDSSNFLLNSSNDTEYNNEIFSNANKLVTETPTRKSSVMKNTDLQIEEENYSYLFIVATHSFDKESLDNEEDRHICLSFEKDDVAFVHAVDESGWGEVTLIKNNENGWVPFNYFTDVVKYNSDSNKNRNSTLSDLQIKITSREPMDRLLSECGKFLLYPYGKPVTETINNGISSNHDEDTASKTFNIQDINNIRDGVKILLEKTGSISRSNDLVRTKPLLRKTRKRLLATWYSLMVKADSYKNTTDREKINLLLTIVYKIVKRAFLFYDVWAIEKQSFENEKKLKILNTANATPEEKIKAINNKPRNSVMLPTEIKYLDSPPMTSQRLADVSFYLIRYLSLILGRMDMIENNTAGCEILEYLVHQIILLLRELLYISKSCSSMITVKYNSSYDNMLDHTLDPLLSLVSELVSAVKVFVTKTLHHASPTIQNTGDMNETQRRILVLSANTVGSGPFLHTEDGSNFIKIVSQMTKLIDTAIRSCDHYLRLLGDFQLGSDRSYPDFDASGITPQKFIKICSTSLLKDISGRSWIHQNTSTVPSGGDSRNTTYSSKTETPLNNVLTRDSTYVTNNSQKRYSRNLTRFSAIRTNGDQKDYGNAICLTAEGTQFLYDFELSESNNLAGATPSRKSFSRSSIFEPFKIDEPFSQQLLLEEEEDKDEINNTELMNNETLLDTDEKTIIGASFRALVYHLTNELNKPTEFFVSVFLMNFKSFATSSDFMSELVARFDVDNRFPNNEFNSPRGNFPSMASIIKSRRRLVLKIMKIWMQSYWDYANDFNIIPVIINFLNESAILYLPAETRVLIIIASKLISISPKNESIIAKNNLQLVPRNIKYSGNTNNNNVSSGSSGSSTSTSTSNDNAAKNSTSYPTLFGNDFDNEIDERIIKNYELTKIPGPHTNSVLLSGTFPSGLLSFALLSKQNIHTLEKSVANYRECIGISSQTSDNFAENLDEMISMWYTLLVNVDHTAKNLGKDLALNMNDFNICELNPLEVAKQLTLIETRLFVSITPNEFLNENFLPHRFEKGLSSNIRKLLAFTNSLSNYVIESIVGLSVSAEKKAERIKQWMRISLSCLYFKNFNSLASIIIALQSHVISRLYVVWENLDTDDMELFEYLAQIIHPHNNYNIYRRKLQELITRSKKGADLASSTKGGASKLIIPFFNLYLQDLTFIYDGNSNYRNQEGFRLHRLINFDKYIKVTKVIGSVQQLQHLANAIVSESIISTTNSPEVYGKRNSVFSFHSVGNGINKSSDKSIRSLPLLQEFILDELWRVHLLYTEDPDRGYNMSIQFLPRD